MDANVNSALDKSVRNVLQRYVLQITLFLIKLAKYQRNKKLKDRDFVHCFEDENIFLDLATFTKVLFNKAPS